MEYKLRRLCGLMGGVGAWVHGCVGGVGGKFACVTWVTCVYKILAWVAWVGILALELLLICFFITFSG